jgi:hypothetical protein
LVLGPKHHVEDKEYVLKQLLAYGVDSEKCPETNFLTNLSFKIGS